MKKTGASLARYRSKQDYATPPEFIAAVEKRFGLLAFDLAAGPENAKAPAYYTERDDSLKQDWSVLTGNLWLNPPYGNIAAWARKCAERKHDQRWTLLLVPASVGSMWYTRHVYNSAMVYCLTRRITFVGQEDPYPRDLVLAAYGYGAVGISPWEWNK